MPLTKVNLAERFSRFEDVWSPRIVGRLNDYDIKLAKGEGEFPWHTHDDTDELFMVTEGRLRIQVDGNPDVVLEPGEVFVVPRGVRHRPIAEARSHFLMLEPRGTLNSGDADMQGTAGAVMED